MIKIVHLTSAHPRYDIRIFIKECSSLAKNNAYEVNLVVADGLGDEQKEGVSIYDVGQSKGRVDRILNTTKKVYIKALELDSDLYHMHDPELLFVGLKLKRLGKKVIFDAHEDLPKQILAKHYLNSVVNKVLSKTLSIVEIAILRRYDYVVAATPIIKTKFLSKGIKSIDVNNFPILDELIQIEPSFVNKTICYIGLLYETRGIREIVKAIENIDVKLIVAGKFYDKKFEQEIKALKGWEKVDFRGFAGRDEIKHILQESVAGLVTLHPTPSYTEAYPVKMFEYMSAGIAVIASNFPLYKNFVEGNDCGICVNPMSVNQIEEAISLMIQNPIQTKKMGLNGKRAVMDKYNWGIEEQKLLKIYKELLGA